MERQHPTALEYSRRLSGRDRTGLDSGKALMSGVALAMVLQLQVMDLMV